MICCSWNTKYAFDHFRYNSLEKGFYFNDLNRGGDEIIVPSFTFYFTVNAFLLRGAVLVFCDIRKDTMNLDEDLIEKKITENTRFIYAVDYAGIPCEMDKITQAVGFTYKRQYAGILTEFGCYSFTKQRTMLWEKAVPSSSTEKNIWNELRLYGRREQTAVRY